MVYDKYMYPQEQAGYQQPPLPSEFQWLMDQYQQGGSEWDALFGQVPGPASMAQRMKTMTPDYPMGQGFVPGPEAAPQFDPTQVNPGLSSFPPPPNPIGQGGVQEQIMAQQPPDEGRLAQGTHDWPMPPGHPGRQEPPQLSYGMDTQPAFGLTDQMEPQPTEIPPGPMEGWLMDYNKQTDDYIAAQQQHAKNLMWIQMGQSMLANATDPSMALAGMGQAVGQYGANEPAMEQYRQGREGERLDSLYKMERIRSSQAPKEFAPQRSTRIRLADSTYAEDMGNGKFLYNDGIYTLSELNSIALGAGGRKTALKENAESAVDQAEWEQKVQATMEQFNWPREKAEEMVNRGMGAMGDGRPAGAMEVPDPESQVKKARADVLRQQIIDSKDPDLQRFLEMDDDELLERYDNAQ